MQRDHDKDPIGKSSGDQDGNESFEWEEGPDGLCVRFPAPPPEPKHVGCAIAALVLGVVVTALLVIAAGAHLADDPNSPASWIVAAAALAVMAGTLWYLAIGVRKERIPSAPVEPSVLTIRDNELRIERTGRDRGTDVSWDLSEVTDIRIFRETELPPIMGPRAILSATLSPEDIIEITVVLPSGQFDDVLVRVPNEHWIGDLEKRLRGYLHLPS